MKILLTGGLGFIGSHTCVELLNNNYEIIIIDNLSNSSIDVIDKIVKITNKNIYFYQGNIGDKTLLNKIFNEHNIDTVIHFAAHKSVDESVKYPLKYYDNNIIELINLLTIMIKYKIKKIIFSSSATVYGDPISLPLTENSKLNPINPYGRTKLMSEQILQDVSKAYGMKVIILRYFNPVGAHKSGLLGENPNGTPNNLFPYILQVIAGKKDCLNIFGKDYDTTDGTAIRDYIHVMDLAKAHVKSLENLNSLDGLDGLVDSNDVNNIRIYNLGTGKGYSVLDVVNMFNKVLLSYNNKDNKSIKYEFTERREGDASEIYTDCSLVLKELGWSSIFDLEQMVIDSLVSYY